MKKLLIVKNDNSKLSELHNYFSNKGYTIDCANNGLTALHLISSQAYELIILDVVLQDINGFSICQSLRNDAHLDTPVILLAENNDIENKLLGFKSGADDYLVKPYHIRELLIRVESILRIVQKKNQLKQLKVGDLELNLDTLSVTREDKFIKLKPAELKLLQKLMRESPNVIKKETLENMLWGDDLPDKDNLKAHIYLLRKNIDKPFKHKMLTTIHSIGYQLVG